MASADGGPLHDVQWNPTQVPQTIHPRVWWIDAIQEGLEIRSSDLADVLFNSAYSDNDLEIILMPFVVCQCL